MDFSPFVVAILAGMATHFFREKIMPAPEENKNNEEKRREFPTTHFWLTRETHSFNSPRHGDSANLGPSPELTRHISLFTAMSQHIVSPPNQLPEIAIQMNEQQMNSAPSPDPWRPFQGRSFKLKDFNSPNPPQQETTPEDPVPDYLSCCRPM